MTKVRCEKRQSHCPYFTDGKVYEAHQKFSGDLPLRVYEVRDDRGNARVIVPDGEPCPHFTTSAYPRDLRSLLAGRFHLIEEQA